MATTDAPNTTTLPEAALQPTMTEQDKSRKVISVIDTLLTAPTAPTGTTVTPTLQQVQTGETMATPGLTGTVVAPTPTPGTTPTISNITAPTATQTAAQTAATPSAMTAAQVAGTTPTMTAAQATGLTAPAVAATGTIDSDATVRGQLAKINTDIQTSLDTGSALPAYLRGVAKATQTAMSQRGLSSSSMMAEALADGLLTASIPIAQADAETYKQMIFQNLNNRQQAAITNANSYFQMDMTNLSNRQQASLQNLNVRQAFLLSDQAASNAAAQFNATSKNQVDQFYSNLSQQIKLQNAARADAMNQFAVVEKNKIAGINAGNTIAVEKSNADRAQVWKTPSYGKLDLHLSYKLPEIAGLDMTLHGHVFNALDAIYVQDATDNSSYNSFNDDGEHDASSAEVYLGTPRYFNMGLTGCANHVIAGVIHRKMDGTFEFHGLDDSVTKCFVDSNNTASAIGVELQKAAKEVGAPEPVEPIEMSARA
mgnify:CR=1 FL=1